ncbi:MAG: AAA family ATPase, partial [bacterium]|nr:AAA family ATPase [bacterium]
MMINTLLVRNYRLFGELKIDKLSRVNLFVGKNNSGKSCLLEALQIYVTGADSSVLTSIVSNREEDWNDTNASMNGPEIHRIDSPFRYLFHSYHFPRRQSGAIEIGLMDSTDKTIKVMPRFYQVSKDKSGRQMYLPVETKSLDQLVDLEVGLELTEGNNSRFLTPLFNLASNKRGFVPDVKQNVQIVSPRYMDNETVEKLWDNINITGLEEEVIKCLQLIDGNVEKIAFVGGGQGTNGTKQRIPIIRYVGSEERIPLKSLGDGMTRLFHIVLSLVNARKGYLLIDEFENGLHWSILPALWEIVFSLAEKLDVQVFATTHNRDCVRGFHDVWSGREEEGIFCRLDAPTGKASTVKPVNYTCETLSDA